MDEKSNLSSWGITIAVTGAVPTVMLMAWWITCGETSPVHGFFEYCPGIQNLMVFLHLPAFVFFSYFGSFSSLMSGHVYVPGALCFYVCAAVQWAIVGFLISLVFVRFTKKTAVQPDHSLRGVDDSHRP